MALLELRRIHGERARLDVDEHRRRAGVADRRHRRHEGERNGDHFVAGADAGRQQRQMERAGAGVDGDGVLGAAVGGEIALEGGDILAEHELRAVQHAEDRAVDVGLDALVLSFEIEERNHAAHSTELELNDPAALGDRPGRGFEDPDHPAGRR